MLQKNTEQTTKDYANKSSPKSFGKSMSLPPRRRMHSPTACASCSQYNA